ncbi:MAG: HAD family phosphatase [Clostridia bacterium]|nr:HAD family phosphatase [Clostridia bacterium]
MPYRILSFDLDCTLLDVDMTLSEENSRALLEWQKRGVTVVPNSGRTLAEMPDFIREHPAFRYLIHSDGAVIFDRETGERHCACLSRELTDRILALLSDYEVLITYRTGGCSYVDERLFCDAQLAYYQMGTYYREFLYETNRPIPDFERFCREAEDAEMLCVFFHDDRAMEACRARLLETGEVIVASSAPHNLEIFSIRADKGNALLRLAALLGVDRADTLAVGDSENDADMLQKAGLGLAMRNASPVLKECADAVANCSNDEHIARYLLEHYAK